ncbi:MAG TPA: ABC transporter ATP-binding protein [Vicinamibacterales bacterium]|nr:ABC transporter ATP-binding protein [Vicinamibacterales bacterium]
MLRLADVWFAYDRRRAEAAVVRGVTLEIRPGDIVGLLGPNGAGKTTLLRLAAGLLEPSRGEVTLDDAPLARLGRTAVARRMAVVPQETHLAFDYSALEVVLMGRYPHLSTFALETPRDLAIARRAMEATGTAALADRPFSTLSGGEKQRVIIASALAQLENGPAGPPRYLLLDEPTASLDLGYQLEMAGLVARLREERRLGIVVSAHDLNLAAAVCDRLVWLRGGRVLAQGPTREVLTPAVIRATYGVAADVAPHPFTGRLMVVPLARDPSCPSPEAGC